MNVFVRLAAIGVASALPATATDPLPKDLLAKNTHSISFSSGTLSGPGFDVLKRATADAQFVFLGEGHDDQLTPIFAEALLRSLKEAHGFDRVALEQDPVAIELACAPERRGKVAEVAKLAKRYPTLFEFVSDQDLAFIATACALGRGPRPVWGLEQSLGAERYLEELESLASSASVKALVALELAEARRVEKVRNDYVNYLHDDPGTSARLDALE